MVEILVQLRDRSVAVGYANDFNSALQRVMSLNLDAHMATFKEVKMTAMRQGRDTLERFARKENTLGV